MPTYQRPGLFIEEKAGGPAAIQGVSASTLALIGMTVKGVVNDPTLVTTQAQFEELFGGFDADKKVPTSLFAFLNNGGKKAYIVRVTASDAVASSLYGYNDGVSVDLDVGDGGEKTFAGTLERPPVPSSMTITTYTDETPETDETIETGNGATVDFDGVLAEASCKPGSLTITYMNDKAPVVDQDMTTVSGDDPDGVIVIWKTSGAGLGEGTLDPFSDAALPIKPGTLTFDWIDGADNPKTMTDDGAGGFAGDGNAAGSTVDYTTGEIVLDTTGDTPKNGSDLLGSVTKLDTKTITDDGEGALEGDVNPAGTNTVNYLTGAYDFKTSAAPTDGAPFNALTADYTPMTQMSVTELGDGLLVGDSTAGTVDYDTGEWSVTWTEAPTDDPTYGVITATLDEALFKANMKWPGVEGDRYRLRIEGNENYAVQGQGTYTRWDVMVDWYDDNSAWTEKERFLACVFDDSTSSAYFPTVLNDERSGSGLFEIETPLLDDSVPTVLSGTAVLAEVIDVGDGSTAAFSGTLAGGSAVPYSVSITTTSIADATLTVTDDGSGNLIGDVAAGGTNTIDYETGAWDVTFSANVKNLLDIEADYYEAPASTSYTSQMADGDEGTAVASSDIYGASLEAGREGIYALDSIRDNLLVGVPDFAGDETADGNLCDWVDGKEDRFAILTTPEGMTVAQAKDYKQNSLGKLSTKCALYFPWVKIVDPVSDTIVAFPPIGHVAGRYASTIQRKNVAKAPAGKEDGQLKWLTGMEYDLSDTEIEVLYPIGVNPLVTRVELGSVVWGARTLDPTHEYKYVQARLTYQFIAKSLFRGLQWVTFENNGSDLWARVRLQVGSFMNRLYKAGYFSGDTATDAFFVVCDETNNPEEIVDAGQLVIDVGFAPTKPAEFVPIRIQQKTLSG